MTNLFSPKWWIELLISTIFTMVCIYAVKLICKKVNIPVLTNIANEV